MNGGGITLAQIEGTLHYSQRLRRDMEELASNLWLGQPIDGQKAGNLRAAYLVFDLTGIAAGTTFTVRHPLGEVPLGYLVVGTPQTHVIPLSPGTDASGSLIPWSDSRIYLKAPNDTDKRVTLLLWGTDSPSVGV